MRFAFWSVIVLIPIAGQAQERASFECAKAAEPIETAICKDPALARLDREIASAYAEARGRLDAAGRRALQTDQESFLQSRATALGWPDASVLEVMTERLAFLRGLRAPAGGGDAAFLGEWRADFGTVTVTRARSGRLAVAVSTAAPVTARWLCDASGEARLRDGALAFQEDGVMIVLRRDGSTLQVDERMPAEWRARGYCGANGSLSGRFFKVR